MSEFAGLAGFVAVLVLAFLRIPIAVAMGVVGAAGAVWLQGWQAARYVMSALPFEAVFPYGLSVVPLFIFMGVFAAHSGLSRNLYEGVYAVIGARRAGLAVTTIGACAVFGAVCGSSLATCATMGRVAMPEMRRRGYGDSLAAAAVAAGGTLGVLIPPSIILVIYALVARQSIGALFAAALVPGILATALYMAAVLVQALRRPELAPAGEAMPVRARLGALARIWDAVILIVLVIGGIYAGWFSPTEAAAVGAGGALLITCLKRRLTWQVLSAGVEETAALTGMIFLILIGAALFNFFIESSRLPATLVGLLEGSGLPELGVLLLIVAFYIVLGCFMDSLSMILLTLTPVLAVVDHLALDPVWFGVLLVTVAEIGLITPPVGMNLFVLQGTTPGLALGTIVRGIVPFIAADIVRIGILIAFPALALWLPRMLGFG